MNVVLKQTAPAKVNLALHVVGRRGDGYHLLESLAVFTRDGDVLTARHGKRDAIVVKGRFAAQVPIDGANLVAKARDLMRGAYGAAAETPVALELEKNLPVASGIGGGSSDAAATMRLLAELWDIEADAAELGRLGLSLGADIPMCLAARPLVARGIGDRLNILPRFPKLDMVLVNPGIPVATASVFSALQTVENDGLPALPGDETAIAGWLAETRNDLQAAAIGLAPEVAMVLEALEEEGASVARMSGSGATCFGLFRGHENAAQAAANIRHAQPAWFVTATQSTQSEAETKDARD